MPRKTDVLLRRPSPVALRFNEAAARCRGKRVSVRVFASPTISFNEAAARCRGKRRAVLRVRLRETRFNEAAARCRGKPTCA